MENLLLAWQEFLSGKKMRLDVQKFQLHLADNLYNLHDDLKSKVYSHSGYEGYKIKVPKPRDIHKATVRDRLLHHAIYRKIYPFFDNKFVADSYSCRLGKGTHRAIYRFRRLIKEVSFCRTKTVWVLKCDVRKFFASIDQPTLFEILKKNIHDTDLLLLLRNIIKSFSSTEIGKGLPLGNLTSQLLVNIYMNEFDQFVKHKLKVKYYIRYADDFAFLSQNKSELEAILPRVSDFLQKELKLNLHPDKVYIKTLASGVDFLGWIHFTYHWVPRTSTKLRMFKKLEQNQREAVLASYLGMLSHGNAHRLSEKIKDGFRSSLDKTRDKSTE
jgi:retron-type reverse transcriptase